MLLTILHALGADGPGADLQIDTTPPGADYFLAPGEGEQHEPQGRCVGSITLGPQRREQPCQFRPIENTVPPPRCRWGVHPGQLSRDVSPPWLGRPFEDGSQAPSRGRCRILRLVAVRGELQIPKGKFGERLVHEAVEHPGYRAATFNPPPLFGASLPFVELEQRGQGADPQARRIRLRPLSPPFGYRVRPPMLHPLTH